MLTSCFEKMAKSCRFLAVVVSLTACLASVANGQAESNYFWDGVQDVTMTQLCGSERFLDIGRFSAEECKKLVNAHATECRDIIEKLASDLSLAVQIYRMCLESKVLLSETGG